MQRSKTKKSKCRKERTVIFPPMSKLPFHYGLQLRIYPSCEQMRIIHRNIDAGRWYYNQLVAWGRLRLPKRADGTTTSSSPGDACACQRQMGTFPSSMPCASGATSS